MRVLVLGASGYIGRFLCQALSSGHEVYGSYFRQKENKYPATPLYCDVRDESSLEQAFAISQPRAVVHLAYDMADMEASICLGADNLLRVWEKTGKNAFLLFASTDVVFDGENPPYRENDEAEPANAYGRAKKEAEEKVLMAGGSVFRTSLVYGFDPPDDRTLTLLKGLVSGNFAYPYFRDEVRCPVYAEDLALALVKWLEKGSTIPRLLHLAGPDRLGRHGFALGLAACFGHENADIPKAELSESPVKRPRDISLDSGRAEKALGVPLRSLEEVMKDPGALFRVLSLKRSLSLA